MASQKKRLASTDAGKDNNQEMQNWHTLPSEEVLAIWQSDKQGLSAGEVRNRQEKYGRNKLPDKKSPSIFTIFIHQFMSPLIYILLVAGLISIVIQELADASFIMGVVLLNAIIGTFQEYKSEKSAEALQQYLKSPATVFRNGERKEIDAEEVVLGDIVMLESGGRVPADLRLFVTRNLSIDESLLTGESTGVEKSTEVIKEENIDIGDRKNLAYAGSTVLSGRGQGVVVGIGLDTALGRLSREVLMVEAAKSPLTLRMDRFIRYLSYIIIGVILLLSPLAYMRGMTILEVFFFSVALAVAAIPEGLPVAMTVALAIRVNRMAKRHVIVRQLAAVEGLGSCTYIASDKTGTLTVNKQTVRKIVLPDGDKPGEISVSGEGYNAEGKITAADGHELVGADQEVVKNLVIAGILSNEGQLRLRKDGWQAEGDPMDIALLALGYKLNLPPDNVRKSVKINGSIPYESERQFSATFYLNEQKKQLIAAKGATEKLLEHCTGSCQQEKILELEKNLSAQGFRVLAVARGEMSRSLQKDEEADETMISSLKLLGLVGFIDPLRPEVKEAISLARQAGVVVGMVTGDHPKTAFAIAKELGIAETEADVVTGRELRTIISTNPDAFSDKVKRATVFARVSPSQKVQIVEGLSNAGHLVAVTGDGVNDAPALRKANIGVAMGSGTDVTKDTSSIIITDDNFASIVAGIEEGRFAYQNLRQVIYLLIATGAAEVVLFMVVLVLQLPLPLVAVQLLWLNLVTNGIQDVALAFEAGEPGVMNYPPRNPKEGIFNRQMIQQTMVTGGTMAAVTFAVWWWLMQLNMEVSEARNHLLMLMVLLLNFHVLNCRSEYRSVFQVPLKNNPILIGGIFLALGLHLASLHIPVMQDVLQVRPITLTQFAVLLLPASSVLLTSEIFKFFLRRRRPINDMGNSSVAP